MGELEQPGWNASEHSYDTDKHQSYRSQQALVAADATFIHNKHLYQTDKPQLECTQHLSLANIHIRQTGISRNKTQYIYTQTFIRDRQLLVAILTIYAQ